MKMKTRHLIFPILMLLVALRVPAQSLNLTHTGDNTFGTDTIANTDSLMTGIPPTLDSALIGYDIYRYAAENNVRVNRAPATDSILKRYIADNPQRTVHGYRIRLFFDNKQSARGESEKAENLFKEHFPTIPVYRSYMNPYFKVVAGDYRTKSDAMQELGAIKKVFPNAFIIKEYINFPQL